MKFEEFFKKKKINLVLLKSAEPDLFAEFESHYHLMGEKSFDHTKKYWFNLLRRKYHLPDETKVEKVIIENKIAEQTITEAIIEAAEAPTPKLGFKPKFKTGVTTNTPEQNIPSKIAEKPAEELTAETPAPKLGFKPKFKTASAPVENISEAPEKISAPVEETDTPVPKLGFKPKFKPASAPIDNMPLIPEDQADPEVKTGDGSPKLGFKPKFKTAMPKPVPGIEVQTEAEVKDTESQKPVPEIKPAYVPKFQARNLKPKTGDSE